MKHIFYLLTIAPIIWEIMCLINPIKAGVFYMTWKASLKNKSTTDLQNAFSLLMFGYVIWNFIGLFSSQWPLFFALVILSFGPKQYLIYRFVDSFISLFILFFIILNAYHFHIDVWLWFINKMSTI